VLADLQTSPLPSVAATLAITKADSKKAAAPVADKEVAAGQTAKKAVPADVDRKVAVPPEIPSLNSVSGLKGQMALAPMLAMLKGLYQDSKDRIAQQNSREEKSKKWFADKEADHKRKLATIESKFQNHTLSEEYRTNETHDENRYFNYWERCRQRQHRQFHTNLKIQHAMMTKVKKMVEMYEKALSPKAADQKIAKKELGQMTGMPEIVFLQNVQRTVTNFCTESLAEVRKEREELQEPLGVDSPY